MSGWEDFDRAAIYAEELKEELDKLKDDLRTLVEKMEFYGAGSGEWAKGYELATEVWKDELEKLIGGE